MSVSLVRLVAAAGAAVAAAASAVVVELVTGSLPAALVALLGGLIAGGAALVTLNREPLAAAPHIPAQPAAVDTQTVRQRATLVSTCLYLRDRLTSAALLERLDRDLEKVGVQTVAPVGERFDPSVHEAAGATDTEDASLVGTVALVEAPGYLDHGVLLRPPVVTVYQAQPAQRKGPKS